MATPNEAPDTGAEPITPQEDALPDADRHGHGKLLDSIDDDDYQRAAEQERVAAGLADYAPSNVPPATDLLPEESSDEADLAQRGLLDGGGTDAEE